MTSRDRKETALGGTTPLAEALTRAETDLRIIARALAADGEYMDAIQVFAFKSMISGAIRKKLLPEDPT